VTPDGFRRLALALPEVVENAHHGHPDFRVRNKVFATLGWPDAAWGVIKLRPEEQEVLVQAAPGIFEPVPGGWGLQGNTKVHLEAADDDAVRGALTSAWRRAAPKTLAARLGD
jgi:hypothetical protein